MFAVREGMFVVREGMFAVRAGMFFVRVAWATCSPSDVYTVWVGKNRLTSAWPCWLEICK